MPSSSLPVAQYAPPVTSASFMGIALGGRPWGILPEQRIIHCGFAYIEPDLINTSFSFTSVRHVCEQRSEIVPYFLHPISPNRRLLRLLRRGSKIAEEETLRSDQLNGVGTRSTARHVVLNLAHIDAGL